MNINRDNVIKIVCILTIIANIILLFDRFLWPFLNNRNIKREYEKNKKQELLELETKNNNQEEEKEEEQEYIYDEYNELLEKEEAERMMYYVGKYVTLINDKDYEQAYNLLYEDFKVNKFATLEDFEEYAKKTYPNNMYIKFADMHRYGYYYMLEVELLDKQEVGKEEKENIITTIFTIKENKINDVDMSFGI